MLVFRVENKDGIGPYHRGHALMWESSIKRSEVTHPSPISDPLIRAAFPFDEITKISNYIFGFNSLAQLQNWFSTEELSKLNEIGFKVKTYLVPDGKVIQGTQQVLFKREDVLKD